MLQWSDHWGTIKARCGIGRMNFKVDPGLYALGHPSCDSPLVVTANYKMSFDALRQALLKRDAWILVVDTLGVNVWCAAGKGTFSTEAVAAAVTGLKLDRLVSHRRLILPQLAAPGVSAHRMKRLTGFKAVFGPITARALPAFLDAGMRATQTMRVKSFSLSERLVLVPIELVSALKVTAAALAVFVLLGAWLGPGDFLVNAWHTGISAGTALLAAILSGAVLTPLLLPWLPGRAFALKGLAMGGIFAAMWAILGSSATGGPRGFLETAGWFLLMPAFSAYLGMNFTGSSTYTSLSGVRKEMRWAVPMEIAGAATGFVCWVAALLAA